MVSMTDPADWTWTTTSITKAERIIVVDDDGERHEYDVEPGPIDGPVISIEVGPSGVFRLT